MIKLVLPASGHKQAVIEYKNEMLDYNSDFDGCGGLEKAYNYEEWLDGERLRKRLYGNDTVPSDVYLAIRENDNKLLGMIDIRYELSDFLLMYGGSIGYSVRPTERGKGYATQMLTKLLCRLRGTDIDRVLLCCDPVNTASKRVIEKCNGVLENIVDDEPGLGGSGKIARYWIPIL